MIDGYTLELWLYRGLACLLVGLWVFVTLLPLGGPNGELPWPDLMLCMIIAWILRRPDLMPFPLVVFLGLITDLLFFKVPGAWTLILLLVSEALRKSTDREGDSGPAFEAAAVTIALVVAFLGHRALLAVFGVAQPALGNTVLELVFTWAAYPLVVLVTVFILRIRRPDPAETLSFKARS